MMQLSQTQLLFLLLDNNSSNHQLQSRHKEKLNLGSISQDANQTSRQQQQKQISPG
jgi:hypothetical protein